MRRGRSLVSLTTVRIAWLLKARRDPNTCVSRRPICPMGTAIEILEGVANREVLPRVDGRPAPQQYAYCRRRGAGMLLVEFTDRVRRSLILGGEAFLCVMCCRGSI